MTEAGFSAASALWLISGISVSNGCTTTATWSSGMPACCSAAVKADGSGAACAATGRPSICRPDRKQDTIRKNGMATLCRIPGQRPARQPPAPGRDLQGLPDRQYCLIAQRLEQGQFFLGDRDVAGMRSVGIDQTDRLAFHDDGKQLVGVRRNVPAIPGRNPSGDLRIVDVGNQNV